MLYKLKVGYSERAVPQRYKARWNSAEKLWIYETDGPLPEELERFVIREAAVPADDPLPDFERYLTVSALNRMIHSVYGKTEEFRNVFVKGEVANFSSPDRRGNCYFALKEGDKALMNCVLWASQVSSALDHPLKNGQQVAIDGKLDFYEGGGRTQITALKIYDIGAGEAALKLERLRKKLQALGWFAEEAKKPIPKHPLRIGIVTSATGQAIQDFESTARKRNPYVRLDLYPASVQGAYAAASIVNGIRYMDRQGYDLLIVGRGGGSDEELYVFNDESIVTAVHEANTPVVSAVGHTGNFTLIDAVSDGVANTPTGAIEKYVPELQNDLNTLADLERQFRNSLDRVLSRRREETGRFIISLEKLNPAHQAHRLRESLQAGNAERDRKFRQIVRDRERTIAETNRTLEKNSPLLLVRKRTADVRMLENEISGRTQKRLAGTERQFTAAKAALESFRIDELGEKRRREHKRLISEMNHYMNTVFERTAHRLNSAETVLNSFRADEMTEKRRNETSRLSTEMESSMQAVFERTIHRFRMSVTQMHGLSPTAKLVNGFGYLTHDQKPVRSVSELQAGDELTVVLHDGTIQAEVRSVRELNMKEKGD